MFRALTNARNMSAVKRGVSAPFIRASQRQFSSNETFLNGSSANYIDAMHAQWQRDPTSVHASWHAYFSGASYEAPATLGKSQ